MLGLTLVKKCMLLIAATLIGVMSQNQTTSLEKPSSELIRNNTAITLQQALPPGE